MDNVFSSLPVQYLLEKLGIDAYSDSAFKAAFKGLGFEVTQLDCVCENEEYSYYLVNDEYEKRVFVSGDTPKVRCFYYCILLALLDVSDSRDVTEAQMVEAYMYASEIKQCLEEGQKSKASVTKLKNTFMSSFAILVCMSVVALIFLFKSVNSGAVNRLELIEPIETLELTNDISASAIENTPVISADSLLSSLTNETNDNAAVDVFEILDEPIAAQNADISIVSASDVTSSLVSEPKDTPIKPSSASQDVNKSIYYATASGEKYHISSCSYIKDLSKCSVVSVDDVLSGKYTPCKRCIK